MVAVMAFVAALALALALAVEAAAARFGAGLAGNVTVEVPPADTPAAGEARAAAAAAALRGVPGVLSADIIPRAATARLVEPWLGAELAGGGLPLPTLIDLRVDPASPPGAARLMAALARVGPDISVDDHRQWLDRLLAWVMAVRLGAVAVLACAVVGIVLTVALATRAALAIHRDVIEILHMIGAQDGYIARQFQRQALWMGLRGGLAGAALAAGLIYFVGTWGAGLQPGLLPALALGPREWAALAAMPVGAALIAVVVARLVVLRALRRMM
ncbi:MAG: hypothetical protein IT561_26735 [Alphaproteobacteria bacterium]|nr:hypothetical protein [Alphaproteobacteria bacterium]